MSLKPGTKIKQYVIDNLIAKGGMGVVWRGWDMVRNEPVAVKVVAGDLFVDPEFRVRIQDEARRHQRLKHPNIVPVLNVFETSGQICIVMQAIEGTSLDTLLAGKAQHRLDILETVAIIRDILHALDYAHQRGIVHRDVKASNVLLDRNKRAMLIDFGIALAMGEERRTRTGVIVGTANYMSPEQIIRPKHIDHRSDVYSVGCVLYEMLTGFPPFVRGRDGVGSTDFAIHQAHVHKKPTHPKIKNPDIPDDLDAIIMAALEKDPNERIPGCLEFIRLLEQVGAHPSGRSAGTRKKPFFSPLTIVGLLLVLLCLLVWLSRR